MILSKEEILRYLPHRDPFLFIDEVISIDEGNNIHAVMNVRHNSLFLEGHFPGNPIVPGVILIEAMGQASGILGFMTMKKTPEEGSIYVIAGVDKARFRQRVLPGNRVDIFSKVIGSTRGIWKFECFAEVDGKLVCSANILCAERKK
jgi:3-hydroxyacyl-[acyl-carrier-protein] dehydratase